MNNKNLSDNNIRYGFFAALLLIFMFISGCGEDSSSVSSAKGDDFIASVNDKKLTLEEFEKKLNLEKKKFRLEGKSSLKADELLWLKSHALNQLIQEELMIQEASKHRIQVSEEEFKKALADVRSGYQKDQFQRTLEIEEINESEWNNRIKNNLIIKKLIRKVVHSRISVSDEDIRKYFDGHLEEFNKAEQIRALHIMVETETEAQDILKKLGNGPELFSYLARKFSRGLEAKKGGDLGFLEVGNMPEEFEDIFKLKVNEISDVIQTPYGYHVFQVREKIPNRKMSFEESKLLIEKKLIQETQEKAFKKWLLKIKQEARIEVDYKVLDQVN